MKVTKEWLKKNNACAEAVEKFNEVFPGGEDGITVVLRAIDIKRFDWANWLVVRLMTHTQQTTYAVFAAEQVIDIYEAKYPQDIRPRQAIQAAKAVLKNNTARNRAAAASAVASAGANLKPKIIKYGISLLQGRTP